MMLQDRLVRCRHHAGVVVMNVCLVEAYQAAEFRVLRVYYDIIRQASVESHHAYVSRCCIDYFSV